jgi:hypothetical protein
MLTKSRLCFPHSLQANIMLHPGYLLGLFFDPEDGGDMFLLNVCWLLVDYAALCPRR